MLTIHRAERADPLVLALAELLAVPPVAAGFDPFAPEVVSVPTRGIERWLTQQLSAHLGASGSRDGVCANVEFPSPARLISEALALASGISPATDPWAPSRLVWPLIGVVEAAFEERWLEPLTRHLREDGQHRYARLAQIARLFNDYAVYKPALLEAWARGEQGGVGEHLAGAWQPELWRRLREAVDVPSLAERLDPACARLLEQPDVLMLPSRLALFGLTRLPATHLRVLEALAHAREVHLMLLHPSPALWERGEAANRLLASWGRDVRGLQSLLRGVKNAADVHHQMPAGDGAQTLLSVIQAHVRANRPAPGAPLRDRDKDKRHQLDAGDRSISVHACHGRGRQVEVLREAILHRLATDATLEPRDVIVMCPDIEAFAPLIEASFGGREAPAGDEEAAAGGWQARGRAAGEPPALRVRLADRSLRRSTPILGLITQLLELAASRVTASQVLDLADTAPVRARFGFDDDDLAQARDWVAGAGIHWGLDASGRERYRLGEIDAGTWSTGLQRLLLGVAVAPETEALFGGVLPVVEIQSSQIELAGRLCELIDRLQTVLGALSVSRSVAGWAAALSSAADLLAEVPPSEAWQRQQLDEILAELADSGAGTGVEIAPPELRALLGHRLEGRPTRANFRSGHLTFCTLAPMRSVPHRVICLLGLDDGVFPRQPPRDGDNLLLADPQPGDRDPRTEDRQLLLDALLAAQEALIITYSGNDERTNAPLPPAVPVGELLDTIDATARLSPVDATQPVSSVETTPVVSSIEATERVSSIEASDRARDRVVVHHPLQAFDPRNFVARGSEPARAAQGPWSFDAAALDGAQALEHPRSEPPPFLPTPLAPSPGGQLLTLDELIAFVQRPARAFLRQRLGISVQRDEDEIDDALPIELDGLARWGVGQRLLEARLDGVASREAMLAEIARGTLPPGELGRPVLAQLWPNVEALAELALAYRGGQEARTLATNITLGDGARLTGSVAEVRGHVLLSVSYSRLNPRHRLAAWVRLLALSAAHPEIPFETVTIARASAGGVSVARIPQLGGTPQLRRETAMAELNALVALRADGLRAPLPVPCGTAHAYAEAVLQTGDNPVAAAGKVWESSFNFSGEQKEPEHILTIGETLDFSRLGELALAIWQPLLTREVVEQT
jgi:exodeoxyribonuclease V gamma subunit